MRPAPPDLSFAIIAAVVTVACAALAWRLSAEDDRRARWPAVQGKVGRAWAEPRWPGFAPRVDYAFTLGGRVYSGSEVLRPGWFATKDALDSFVVRHPIGSAIDVHLDPKDPMRSYVRVEPAYSSWKPWGSTVLVLGATLSLLLTGMFANAYLARRRELKQLRR